MYENFMEAVIDNEKLKMNNDNYLINYSETNERFEFSISKCSEDEV